MIVLSLLSNTAFADAIDACSSSHVSSQRLRRDGKLLEARAKLLACSAEACPELVRNDCTTWAEEVMAAVPSIVIEALDEHGADLTRVVVRVDGTVRARRVVGRPLEIDPGEHQLSFESPAGKRIEQSVTIRAGEKMRRIRVSFVEPVPSAPPAPDGGSSSPLVYVFGGLAVIGLGGFVGFGLAGRSKQDELEECAPDCDLDEVKLMRRSYVIADVSLAVGLLSSGLTAYFVLSKNGRGEQRAFVSAGPRRGGLGLAAGAAF